jgi:pimeloyl-ACP methyl ester carboxylesterase
MMYASLVLWTFATLLVSLSFATQPFHGWNHGRIQLKDVSIHFRYSASGKPPLLLIHGYPEHSPTWTHIGPILAEQFTVIAPDNRGMGESSLANNDNYTAAAGGEDHIALLNFLNIKQAYVFAHDKGVGLAASLALEHPDRIAKLVLAEYVLPGYGYPTSVTSTNPYYNWQLAFFAVPDAAQYFIQGREREMLAWYFWHASYSGNSVFSSDVLEMYTRSISKPGFLRAGLSYFGAAFEDEKYFVSRLNKSKLEMPLLVMGGEASIAPESVLRSLFADVADDLTTFIIPKSGHWIVSAIRQLVKFLS